MTVYLGLNVTETPQEFMYRCKFIAILFESYSTPRDYRKAGAQFVPEPALLSTIDLPHSPHHEAKQKVKENMWEMSFTENGR